MEKKEILLWILAVALIVAVVYIAVEKLQAKQFQELMKAYQQGYQKGLTDAIATLYAQTENCQVTTITLGNKTRQLIDTACIGKK